MYGSYDDPIAGSPGLPLGTVWGINQSSGADITHFLLALLNSGTDCELMPDQSTILGINCLLAPC